MLATVTVLRLSARRWPWPLLWLLAAAVVRWPTPGRCCRLASGSALSQSGCCLPAPDSGAAGTGALMLRQLGLLREQLLITLALAPLTLLLFGQVSLVGLLANAAGHPVGDAGRHAAGPVGRAVGAAVGCGGSGRASGWAGCWSTWRHCRWQRCPSRRRRCGPGVAGVLGGVLLVMRLPWTLRLLGPAAAAAGAVLASRATGAGPVRAAGGRHRPGQCRAGAHRHARPALRHRAALSPTTATPATGCWCRCCARSMCGWTGWC